MNYSFFYIVNFSNLSLSWEPPPLKCNDFPGQNTLVCVFSGGEDFGLIAAKYSIAEYANEKEFLVSKFILLRFETHWYHSLYGTSRL